MNDLSHGSVGQFFEAVMKEVQCVLRVLHDDPIALEKIDRSVEADITGVAATDGETIERKKSRYENFVRSTLFCAVTELNATFDSLTMVPIYLRSFPYKRSGITPSAHLRYHVEHHLQEIYILKERLLALLNRLEKVYRGTDFFQSEQQKFQALYPFVNKVLKPIIGVRSSHVHAARYDDPDIGRLSSLELLSTVQLGEEPDRLMRFRVDFEFKNVRRDWKQRAAANNDALRELVDHYFQVLCDMFLQNEQIRLPSGIDPIFYDHMGKSHERTIT